jgi:Putative zinc-finger
MDCSGIQELLSEYIDGTLDAKSVQAVEEHISACQDCKEALDSLNEVIKELNALEPVKAPADFLEKIHQRMESRSNFRRLFKTFFIPFKIKIPLQLAAAAFASILVVMVLNLQKSEYRKMQLLKISNSQWLTEKSKTDHLSPEFEMKAKPSGPVVQKAPKSSSDIKQNLPPQSYRVKTFARPSNQRKPEPSSPVLAAARSSAGKGQPIALALVLKPVALGGAYAPDADMQTTTFARSDKKTMEKEKSEKDVPGGKIETGQKNRTDDLFLRMTHITRSLKGKILAKEYHKQSNRLVSIHVQIPAKNYASYCKELARLADFKIPPPALSAESLETVNILINIAYPGQ